MLRDGYTRFTSSLTRCVCYPQFDFDKALKRALGGGLSGAAGANTLRVGWKVLIPDAHLQRWCYKS